MQQAEKSHWYYTDDLILELADLNLRPIEEGEFYKSLLHELAKSDVQPYYSPSRYTDEWQYWQKNCRVGSVAIVRQNPKTMVWETLLVKNINKWFYQLNTTWPGGKAYITDLTLWDLATRELKEELDLDVVADKAKVVNVIYGQRATSFVLPLPYDDERLTRLVKQDAEVHSFLWVPVSDDSIEVRLTSKEYRDNTKGVQLVKENPSHLCMAWEMKEAFEKLQKIGSFETKNDEVDLWLDRDPRFFSTTA
jgi:hypothetical protein